MRKLVTIVGVLYSMLDISAQEIVWQKNIKSSTQDFLNQITPTIDGQYLITGSSIQNYKSQNNGYDFHLLKLDQQGNQIWEKYFSGNNHDFLSAAISTQEGGFLIAGNSYSDKGLDKKSDYLGEADIWLIRLNEFGDELWQKSIGSAYDEEVKAVIQTKDLGFLITGNIQYPIKGYGSKDILIIRLDKNGKELSQLILGGKGLDEVEKIIPTQDGGALLGAYSKSNVSGTKKTENYGEGDYWIIKLNKNGEVEWEKNFGGKADDHLRTLAITPTGFLIGGESRSKKSGNKNVDIEDGTDLWLVSLDKNGNDIWQRSYNFGNRDVLMGMSILNSSDEKSSKGILLGGYTHKEVEPQDYDETFWILYLDHEGNEKWRKYIKGETKKEERLSDVKLNKDGSIILAGTSADETGKENWKIVKLGDKQINQLIEKQDIKIYPNPVSDYTYVEIGFDFKEANISLYDMGGRILKSLRTNNKITKINTQSLIQGAYLITIQTDTNKTANSKLIKIKQN
ncbi:T9SS type A sorting domain-containing protein [Chryseobacterium gambrini]|uniref:T9SS type A sorting domain-containing protein n=1 Tax=Chryseobacterium gambrini TaxID=373672 RepID=A0ABN7CJC2_9FLAO|nr:T9SS type A sorting domain-containing protein [Chryseobacterium gambrini]